MKTATLQTTQSGSLRQLNQDEIAMLNEWRDLAYEQCNDKASTRFRNQEQMRGGWGDFNEDKWREDIRARQAGIFCLAIASGLTHKESCRLAGYKDFREWFAFSGHTIWGRIYNNAREMALTTIAEEATQRLRLNLAQGEDKGTKAAMYILDWWKQQAGLKRTEDAKAVNQSGIIYNINLSAPQIAPNVEPSGAIIDVATDQ